MVGLIRARRFHEGGGTVWNTWKGAGAEKRGGETRVQKGGQIGLKGGCLKKGRLEPYYKLCITEHTCWSLACNLLVIKSFARGIIACLKKILACVGRCKCDCMAFSERSGYRKALAKPSRD